MSWDKAKFINKQAQCPQCRPYHATHVDRVAGKLTYPKVETHELDDCFIHVCINHSIVWREVKE